jgi:hypothetical protein
MGLMKNPNTTMELAGAIENLIGTYLDGVRAAARQAVERGLIGSAGGGPPGGRGKFTARRTAIGNRRTSAQIGETCAGLCEGVRARPGVSMVELAAQLGATVVSLQLPMAKLKAEGRVRSVGQRHLTRYYPAVIRAVAGKD